MAKFLAQMPFPPSFVCVHVCVCVRVCYVSKNGEEVLVDDKLTISQQVDISA